ncbi:hypothetical protein QBC45DRAFT_136314 [Copromyces sp. CBS 386.78]|nr:hypothetical protein QBC45DRAFT_136314 [Copromyces sp. CBS 386.78]
MSDLWPLWWSCHFSTLGPMHCLAMQRRLDVVGLKKRGLSMCATKAQSSAHLLVLSTTHRLLDLDVAVNLRYRHPPAPWSISSRHDPASSGPRNPKVQASTSFSNASTAAVSSLSSAPDAFFFFFFVESAGPGVCEAISTVGLLISS